MQNQNNLAVALGAKNITATEGPPDSGFRLASIHELADYGDSPLVSGMTYW